MRVGISRRQGPQSERGQAMVEFLVILPAMLMLIFGAIQFALIFHAKITLNYAAFEAARAGSLGHADFKEVREGFARGLAPLYSYAGEDKDQVAAFQVARKKVLDLVDAKVMVRIERLSPSKTAFSQYVNQGEIPNDSLLFRSSAFKPGKPGPLMSIQDANLLHLRITYWYPLYVPLINTMIASFICNKDETDRWDKNSPCGTGAPHIPLTAVAAIRMQTPARESVGYFESLPGS